MADRFHRAARDGNLDMLREATRRDSNRADEDGMTPTLLAAYSGNLWALRVLIGRGGNPDCCDVLGNTALHHAASNGHANCTEYLVSFGANIWAVDNDLHSAFDHASLHGHQDIIRLLDNAIALQLSHNRKTAEKLKVKAVMDAERNRKKYEKLHEETKRRMEKDEKRFIMQPSESQGGLVKKAGGTIGKVFASIRGKKDTFSVQEPKLYSDYLNGSSRSRKVERKVIEDLDNKLRHADKNGRETVRSVTSHDNQVVYTNHSWEKNNHSSCRSNSLVQPMYGDERKDCEHYNTGDSGIVSDDGSDSGLFNRPHFGNIAFLPKPFSASHISSLPTHKFGEEHNDETTASEAGRTDVRTIPWTEDDVENLDDDDTEKTEYSTLEMFLSAHNLTQFMSCFTEEKVDFVALLLLTDEDMMQMGLPLGPRRKLRDAIARHKEVMDTASVMEDTHL